jgi:hypothetical protein
LNEHITECYKILNEYKHLVAHDALECHIQPFAFGCLKRKYFATLLTLGLFGAFVFWRLRRMLTDFDERKER